MPTYNDNFNRANATPLDGTWASCSTFPLPNLVDNGVQGGLLAHHFARWSGGQFGNNQSSQVTIRSLGRGPQGCFVRGAFRDTVDNPNPGVLGYTAYVALQQSETGGAGFEAIGFHLYKLGPVKTFSLLGRTGPFFGGPIPAAGDVIKLEAIGQPPLLTVYLSQGGGPLNSIIVVQENPVDAYSCGHAGIDSNSDNGFLDDWEGVTTLDMLCQTQVIANIGTVPLACGHPFFVNPCPQSC